MDNAAVQDASAAPSPASPPPDQAAVVPEIPDSRKDPEGYKRWRETGDSKAKPKAAAAESAPAETSADGEEPEEKTAPAPEAGEKPKQEQKPRTGAADRLQELLSDLKRAGLTPSELKTFKREAQQAKPPEQTVKPPEPPPPLEAPKFGEHASWEDLRKADFQYLDAHTKELIQQAILEDRRQQAQEAANRQAAEIMQAAMKRYGDDAGPVIASTAQSIFNDESVNGTVKGILNDSPVLADLLFVMGSKREDLDELVNLAKTNPGQAIRKVVVLEQLVQEELRKQQSSNGHSESETQRDESGKFVSAKVPAKKVSEAPPPATEVGGKSTPPKDAAIAAVDRGDFRAFRSEMNRREFAARKGT